MAHVGESIVVKSADLQNMTSNHRAASSYQNTDTQFSKHDIPHATVYKGEREFQKFRGDSTTNTPKQQVPELEQPKD